MSMALGLGLGLPFGGQVAGAASYTGLIANFGQIPNAKSGTVAAQANGRQPFWLLDAAVSGTWRVIIPGFYVTTTTSRELGTGATMTVRASVETPGGTVVQLTFSGSSTGTMPSVPLAGSTNETGYLVSDTIALDLPATSNINGSPSGWVRIWCDTTNGFFYGNSNRDTTYGSFEFAASGLSDRTGSTGSFFSASAHSLPFMAIVGPTTLKTVGGVGDSRMYGHLDNAGGAPTVAGVNNQRGNKGEIFRGVPATVPFVNLASFGSTVQNYLSESSCRAIMFDKFSHLIVNLGVNDIFNGRTVAQIQANHTTLSGSALFTNVRRKYCCTVGPEATSTGNTFESDANQTGKTGSAVRTDGVSSDGTTGYNDTLVLGTLNGYNGFFDGGRYIQSPTKRSVWLNDGTNNKYVTADGVHQNATGYATTAQAVTDGWSAFYV